ncbi:MAG TPA: cobalamin-binding protein, partial [Clostridium sp.]|nr:cobalamin-binding protein [Clostridium sp.]
MIEAMSEVGVKFKNNEIYVPEMLMAAKAMAAGMKVLEPILTKTGVKPVGKAVIGTV